MFILRMRIINVYYVLGSIIDSLINIIAYPHVMWIVQQLDIFTLF